MEEAKRRSRKRRRPSPSNPFKGVLTRSKSQKLQRRNRSGRARKTQDHLLHHTRSLAMEDPPYDVHISYASIKDLRARRVFSPFHEDDGPVVYSDAVKDSKNGDVEKPRIGMNVLKSHFSAIDDFETGFHGQGQCLDGMDSDSLAIIGNCCLDELNGEIISYSDTVKSPENRECEKPSQIELNTSNRYSSAIDGFETAIHRKDQCLNDADSNSPLVTKAFCLGEENGIDSSCLEDARDKENAEFEVLKCGASSDTHKLDFVTPSLSAGGPSVGPCEVEQQSDENNGCAEDEVQNTPPDADIFGKQVVDNNGGNDGEEVLQAAEGGLGNSLNRTICRGGRSSGGSFNTNIDQRNVSASKRKLVLNPCSRLKVYATPSSFNYRRLLPYLMDISNDNSRAYKDGQNPKLGKGVGEKQQLPSMATQCQEISKAMHETGGSPMEGHTNDFGSSPATILTPTDALSDNNGSPLPINIQKNCASQVQQFILDLPEDMENADGGFSPNHRTDVTAVSSSSPVSVEVSCGEENRALILSHHSSVDDEDNCLTSTMERTTDVKPVSSVVNISQVETFVSSGLPIAGLTKGILKKNPRGCRGLCTCLSCASFRLHAERAFEFSRNQMQDAEEVASELIEELACLRNMLEKSVNCTNDHAIPHVNQVKEACRKASVVEELAKDRLGQMNYDLGIHCRIACPQRPRVKFANNVEKMALPNANLPSGLL